MAAAGRYTLGEVQNPDRNPPAVTGLPLRDESRTSSPHSLGATDLLLDSLRRTEFNKITRSEKE